VVRYTLTSEAAGLSVQGIHIARIVDGLIVEDWENFDEVGMMMQLGQFPWRQMQRGKWPGQRWSLIATGFNGPQGILVDADGNVWVIDAGVGGDMEMPFVNPETGEAKKPFSSATPHAS
jgi:hypothetical protein